MIRNTVIGYIVRPPRGRYNDSHLSSSIKLPNGDTIYRQPIILSNSRNQTIIGSFYPSSCLSPGNPCVVYLHGNASNQIEGTYLLQYLNDLGISLCCFDASGSGNSDGEYISLGYFERNDLNSVINFIRKEKKVENIVLWGRSMGAAIAPWYAGEHSDICGIVCDSPYCSLTDIAKDLVYGNWFLSLLLKFAIPYVNWSLKKQYGFKIDDVNPISTVKKAKCPALFIHSYSDTFINIRESRELYQAYGGAEKYLLTVPGNHNSERSISTLWTILRFILNCFDFEIEDSELVNNTVNDNDSINDNSSQHFENLSDMFSNM